MWPRSPRVHAGLTEAECPNCGGEGAPTGSTWREWETGKTFRSADMLDTQTSNLILVGFSLGLGLVANMVLGPDAFWWGLGTGVILALVLITVLVSRNVQRSTRAYHILTFKCRRCLHQWEQVDGKSPPRYNERQAILADYHAAYGSEHEPENTGK